MDARDAAAQVPDLSVLAGLDTGVAYAACAVIALGMILFYLGPGLRDRFRRTPTVEDATGTAPALPAATSPQLAVDRSDRVSDQFIDHLLRVNAAAARDNEALENELRASRGDVRARDEEIDRLRTQLWRQGGARDRP